MIYSLKTCKGTQQYALDTNEASLPSITNIQHDNLIGTQSIVIIQVLQSKTQASHDN
jgi:hypothetical protein